jgi:hypothetical protein
MIRTDGATVEQFFDFTPYRLEGIWGVDVPTAEVDDAGAPITTRRFWVVGVGATVLTGP